MMVACAVTYNQANNTVSFYSGFLDHSKVGVVLFFPVFTALRHSKATLFFITCVKHIEFTHNEMWQINEIAIAVGLLTQATFTWSNLLKRFQINKILIS